MVLKEARSQDIGTEKKGDVPSKKTRIKRKHLEKAFKAMGEQRKLLKEIVNVYPSGEKVRHCLGGSVN